PFSLLCHHTSPTVIYTLSLHDALPISYSEKAVVQLRGSESLPNTPLPVSPKAETVAMAPVMQKIAENESIPRSGSQKPEAKSNRDRKSTRLNSSHVKISYAVFCLKKKK